MIRPEHRQITFTDIVSLNRECALDHINRIIDWQPLQTRIETCYAKSRTGRPAHPALTMFKILLLKVWYNMSDPQTEEMLGDRLSFRRFAGLNSDELPPDHSTIHRFRDRIAPVMQDLLDEVNRQLLVKGFMVRECTLVDASLVSSAARPPRQGKTSPDSDAEWGGKAKHMIFGYKAHVGMDGESELIRQADLTPASVHDCHQFEAMVSGDESVVFADKGYNGSSRSQWLAERGISDGIMSKGQRGRGLADWEIDINKFISSIRSAVERFFGTMKRTYQFRRCRYDLPLNFGPPSVLVLNRHAG